MEDQDRGFSSTERSLIRLATSLENYGTISEALAMLAAVRVRQIESHPEVADTDAGGRTKEQWIVLLNHYIERLNLSYANADLRTTDGRARVAYSAAIIANLALWLVQSTVSEFNDDMRADVGAKAIGAEPPVDGCFFHSATTPYPTECGPADN